MKQLLEDLEIVLRSGFSRPRIQAYNRLHNLLTKLTEVDVEDLEYIINEYQINHTDDYVTYNEVNANAINLLDILKEKKL